MLWTLFKIALILALLYYGYSYVQDLSLADLLGMGKDAAKAKLDGVVNG